MKPKIKAAEQKLLNAQLVDCVLRTETILDPFGHERLQQVESLLAAGAQLASLEISDRTRLFDAANSLRRTDLAFEVAKSGVDWKQMMANGSGKSLMRPAFMSAGVAFDERIFDVVLKSGVDFNTVDAQNRSILHVACMSGVEKVVNAVLERESRIDAVDDGGRLPLHVAAEFGHAGICRRLIEHGADVNALTRLGKSPLLIAVCKGHEEASMTLLNLGADPLFLFKGKSLSHWAEKENHPLLSEKFKAVESAARASAELSGQKQAKALQAP